LSETGAISQEQAALRRAFGCGAALADTIAALGRSGVHERGAVLWPRGEAGAAGLLTLGRAAELAYGRDGSVLVLHALAEGEFFGEVVGSGAQGETRVEALSDGGAMHFASSALIRLMESYPLVALAMARHLSARIAAMRQRMLETALLSATGRIAAELLRRSRAADDGVIRPLPVWSELAVIVQSTRETVSRTVSGLEKRGIVNRTGDGLAVVAPHRLEELVY
jgi:CRP/FNR family transcriptional regulator, cyclic AMP receptor protein